MPHFNLIIIYMHVSIKYLYICDICDNAHVYEICVCIGISIKLFNFYLPLSLDAILRVNDLIIIYN